MYRRNCTRALAKSGMFLAGPSLHSTRQPALWCLTVLTLVYFIFATHPAQCAVSRALPLAQSSATSVYRLQIQYG